MYIRDLLMILYSQLPNELRHLHNVNVSNYSQVTKCIHFCVYLISA
jgi:hypothetical protein